MGKIQIISGKWKGRNISVIFKKELRPTLSRARKTLFDWIRPYINESNCLDCFSGSGSLSIEAVSQNASFVISVEIDKSIFNQLVKNVNLFYTRKIKMFNTNILNFLNRKGNPFDIVFLDPPFGNNLLSKTIVLLEKNCWIKKGSLIYLETERRNNFPNIPKSWKIYKKKVGKNVLYSLFKRH
ncbi:16S rRNA (guanine(966)-N(2))-methyltransferase RsmD [Candidatus Riesia pediculicola]|uniref:Ribosomal RNA small subunit methyltransferase D n=1 Tax=Riesia pediculicola (strain USDA) TaxID=515618 RepID=D4G7I4_RIEPU|nr:16S rRNA (guanine(966)-N(2))-methyltransferase RsmD [Candidatus Riesia pediculicola]ADD79775.1 putative methyltransferase [Candidatus Riesia pediculicola USDA]ARC53565.1 hypothetical protein AOE55_00100 [Candidatus Riesia pediculicola]QOJ86222.1 16S rRNA (guanine(966)-N(2))-methyltransferase RsmD [Candidatus Riesia pediculicola]